VTQQKLASAKRLIVKIGSALLIEDATGRVRRRWLEALAEDMAALKAGGTQLCIVSSGAIAIGRKRLGMGLNHTKLEEKQAAAAAGQIELARAYQDIFAKHDMTVAQILLTPSDTEERRRHLNARSTIETLLKLGAVPLINENDTVATDEIRFGDNDRLAARVAQMISADTLVLLSDIDGLYREDPRKNPAAGFVPEVRAITPEIERMAGPVGTGYASGGMVTKLVAAKIAVAAGCRMIIADGKPEHALGAVADGGRCTWFLASASPRTARKRWIAAHVATAGALTVDAGAEKALAAGKSLLPAGVTGVEGTFDRGDAVLVRTSDGRRLGCGLTAYSAADARLILGRKSGEISSRLGYRGRDEMIHRDDLALDESDQTGGGGGAERPPETR
jgi:glutamate 5-kinase